MKWTIVIPTWRRAAMLDSLLGGLAEQTEDDFEVVVVCDGEDAETRVLAESEKHPHLRKTRRCGAPLRFPVRWVFHKENRGLSAARNTGAATARGEFVLFLDDDVAVDRELLKAHDKAHAAAPGWPTVVFGRILEERQTPFVSKTDELLQRAWERQLAEVMPAEGDSPVGRLIGAEAEQSTWFGLNCSIRRELFEKMGGFDERMRSDEEMELGLRLYRVGVQARYAPKAVVRHRGGKDQSAYWPRCWRLSGALDVFRAREKGERSTQVAQLTDLGGGSLRKRMLARASWATPETVLAVADALEKVTNASGSRWAFGVWARLRRVGEYWRAVRGTGIGEREICEMAGARGRILLFHSIARPENAVEAGYYVSPNRFRRFLSWLEMMNYQHVSPQEALAGELPEKNVLLTFDDAYDDLYTELMPEVERRKLRPLVFVVLDRIGRTNVWDAGTAVRQRLLLTLERMRQMQRAGVVFGSHSLTHPMLTALDDEELRREVSDSKAKLEDLLGAAVEWFAYPYGDADRRVRAAVVEAGYKAAVTTNAGFNRWQDPLALNRLEISDEDSLMNFAVKVGTGKNVRKGIVNRTIGKRQNR
ncbi:MAG: polysaccharide deacetylase family protein [Terriglobia bacterium]|nr:polysaccharide deacetylase family protein [Terriglobia bacterium]